MRPGLSSRTWISRFDKAEIDVHRIGWKYLCFEEYTLNSSGSAILLLLEPRIRKSSAQARINSLWISRCFLGVQNKSGKWIRTAECTSFWPVKVLAQLVLLAIKLSGRFDRFQIRSLIVLWWRITAIEFGHYRRGHPINTIIIVPHKVIHAFSGV